MTARDERRDLAIRCAEEGTRDLHMITLDLYVTVAMCRSMIYFWYESNSKVSGKG
jgi:hypothetical protein